MQHQGPSQSSYSYRDYEAQVADERKSYPYHTGPGYGSQSPGYRLGDDGPFVNPETYEHRQDGHRFYDQYQTYPSYDRYDPVGSAFESNRYGQEPIRTRDNWTPPASHPPFPPTGQVRAYHSQPSSRGPSSPVRSGGYVPPHLRGSASPSPHVPPAHSRPPPSSKKGDYKPSLPPQAYVELSRRQPPPSPSTFPVIVPKLLVLDLNGALIYRSGSRGTERSIYPRPYLGNFLEYLFGGLSPNQTGLSRGERPWNVFVWSSAQPHNVRAMVETGFGMKWVQGVYGPESKKQKADRLDSDEGRLMGVWARDRMDLSSKDYGNNVQTFKDLRKIVDHVATPSAAQHSPLQFDEKRVVLLDDSPLKAVNQPWNQLVIPEYDRDEYYASKEAVGRLLRGEDDADLQEGMDKTLLAVIGILEEMSSVDNIPAWVRAGGLTPGVDVLDQGVRRLSMDKDDEPTLEDLPSFAGFRHWYSIPEVVDHWVEKAKKTLEARGIEVDHGLDENGYRRGQITAKSPDTPVRSAKTERYPNFDRSARAWSPSRPVDQGPPPQSPRQSPPRDRSMRSPSYDPPARSGRRNLSSHAARETKVDTTDTAANYPVHSLTDPTQDEGVSHSTHSRSISPNLHNYDSTSTKPPRGSVRTEIPPGVRVESWRTFLFHQPSTPHITPADLVVSSPKQVQGKFDTHIARTARSSLIAKEGPMQKETRSVRRKRAREEKERAAGINVQVEADVAAHEQPQTVVAPPMELSKGARKRAIKLEKINQACQTGLLSAEDAARRRSLPEKRRRVSDAGTLPRAAGSRKKRARPEANERRAARMEKSLAAGNCPEVGPSVTGPVGVDTDPQASSKKKKKNNWTRKERRLRAMAAAASKTTGGLGVPLNGGGEDQTGSIGSRPISVQPTSIP